MVIMSMTVYQNMLKENEIYLKMKEAEIYAELYSHRLEQSDVFDDLHNMIDNIE